MKKYQIGTLFPNLKTNVASYSPTAFCVTLNTITSHQLASIKPLEKDNVDNRRILKHEMRHSIDHISTLWGQRKINDLLQAVNAKLGDDEHQLYKIVDYKLGEHQLHFDKYYTETYSNPTWDPTMPNWGFELSTGIRFDDKGKVINESPITFIKFKSQTGLPINRVPLSIASILEVTATNEEIQVMQDHLQTVPADKKLKQAALNDLHLLKDLLYNSDLALYNAVVHLISNYLQITVIEKAFPTAAQICTIVLNLPDSLIRKITFDEETVKLLGDRAHDLFQRNDLGFIILLMMTNYRLHRDKAKEFSVEEFLVCNGLPTQPEIEKIVLREFVEIRKSMEAEKFLVPFFLEQVDMGTEIFKARGLDGMGCSINNLLINSLYIPFIVTRDASFLGKVTAADLRKDPATKVEIQAWYHLSNELNAGMDEFFSIRGI
jgi:hypothetical protein